ncbi:MAG: sigma-70 family RNA polymerase sigma factor [Pseudomonadota bacterium]
MRTPTAAFMEQALESSPFDVDRQTPAEAPPAERGVRKPVSVRLRSSAAQPDDETATTLHLAYREHAGPLTAMLRRAFGTGPPDPDDVVQQAFFKLAERGGTGEITNLRAFLWRTARNLFFNAQRSRGVRTRYDYEVEQLYFPLHADELTPERVLLAREQLEAVEAMLRKMPAKRRRALILHRIEGLSITEVGKRLGVSRSTASEHIARATADLTGMLLGTDAP